MDPVTFGLIDMNDGSRHMRDELLSQLGGKRYRGCLWWQLLKIKIELFQGVLLARDPAHGSEDSRDHSSVAKPSFATLSTNCATVLSARTAKIA